jgi:hypothetical protein
MNRFCWRLADLVTRMLDPGERDVVRGDLEEAEATGAHALREVLGLAGRRQLLLWTDWRPWLALVALIVPLGMLLSLVSRSWAYGSAIYAWLYVNNWTWTYLDSPGSRLELARHGAEFLLAFVTLACWSWTSGFVLGSLSRRAIWVSGALFCLVLLGEFFIAAPQRPDQHTAVFSLTFYRVVFPLLVRTALVLIPSVWGMRIGFRRATLPARQAIACAIALITMTACTMRGLEMSATGWLPVRSAWLHLMPVAVLWPVGYILFTANWRLRNDGAAEI